MVGMGVTCPVALIFSTTSLETVSRERSGRSPREDVGGFAGTKQAETKNHNSHSMTARSAEVCTWYRSDSTVLLVEEVADVEGVPIDFVQELGCFVLPKDWTNRPKAI